MNLQESGEMYLEAIYMLSKRTQLVRAIDIGGYLGYSKPSVSRALSILKKGELVYSDNNYIYLTEKGESIAIKIYERHVILTEFLKSIGLDDEIASNDACRMEHIISDATFDAIKKITKTLKKSGD